MLGPPWHYSVKAVCRGGGGVLRNVTGSFSVFHWLYTDIYETSLCDTGAGIFLNIFSVKTKSYTIDNEIKRNKLNLYGFTIMRNLPNLQFDTFG